MEVWGVIYTAIMLRCMSLFVAHSDILHMKLLSVAFGALRTWPNVMMVGVGRERPTADIQHFTQSNWLGAAEQ